jgi:hypothetical protein
MVVATRWAQPFPRTGGVLERTAAKSGVARGAAIRRTLTWACAPLTPFIAMWDPSPRSARARDLA